MVNTQSTSALEDYRTIDQLVSESKSRDDMPNISEASLRWLLRGREHNGFNKCVSKLGRKLIIHVPSFVNYLDEKRGCA